MASPIYKAVDEKKKPDEFMCVVCGKPAMFGYGVDLLRKVLGRWYCSDHRPKPD